MHLNYGQHIICANPSHLCASLHAPLDIRTVPTYLKLCSAMACVCHCTTWSKQQLHSFTVVEVLKAHPSSRSSSQKRYGLHKTDNKPLVVVAQAQPQRNEAYRSSGWDRRGMLLGSILVAACPLGSVAATVDDAVPVDIDVLASYAFQAYNEKDLQRARDYFSRIISRDSNPVWLERRGQVLVDMKEFNEALDDFNRAELLYRYSPPPFLINLHKAPHKPA